MIRAAMILAVCSVMCLAEPPDAEIKTSHKVVGGHAAALGQFPMLAAIMERYYHKCAGIIVTSYLVITIADCFDGCNAQCIMQRRVMVGDNNRILSDASPRSRQQIRIRDVFIHEKFKPGSLDNNIAMIKLVRKIEFSKNANEANMTLKHPSPGTKCSVVGWGIPESGMSYANCFFTKVQILHQKHCNSSMKKTVSNLSICAGDEQTRSGPCMGDGGGPLVCDNMVAGMALEQRYCRKSLKGSPFLNIAAYSQWIKTMISKISSNTRKRQRKNSKAGIGFFPGSVFKIIFIYLNAYVY